MPIKENIDPRKNPITTILGIILVTIGSCSFIAIYIVPTFFEVKTNLLDKWWMYFVPMIPITAGLWALFSPDKWAGRSLDIAEKIISKSDQEKQ